MENNNGNKKLMLKYLTPILVTFSLFFMASLKNDLEKIDSKLFFHLTNDEMHTPRGCIVTKSEFNIQKEYLKDSLTRVRLDITKLSDRIDKGMVRLSDKIDDLRDQEK